MAKRIFTLGEIMLRISPQNLGEKIEQTALFRIEPGGSESNVAISLSQLNHDVSFLTLVPDNPIKSVILNYLKRYNVDISYIKTKGARIGLYWTNHGVGPRAAEVIYDRANTSFSGLDVSDFDWKIIKGEAGWFHISGITPGLSESMCLKMFSILAKFDERTKISVDLNYREKLWKWTNRNKGKIQKCMRKLCSKAYLITGNENDFHDSLGYTTTADHMPSSYYKVARDLFRKISRLCYIGISLRTSFSASRNNWRGLLFARKGKKTSSFKSRLYKIDNIVDRVGTGDSFTGGIIHGILCFPNDYKRIVDFAIALSALNHTVLGDASQFDEDEVQAMLLSGGKGRIIR